MNLSQNENILAHILILGKPFSQLLYILPFQYQHWERNMEIIKLSNFETPFEIEGVKANIMDRSVKLA